MPPIRVVIVPNARRSSVGMETRRMYVHADIPAADSRAAELYAKLVAGKTLNVVYDEPWFWSVSMAMPR